MSTFVLLAQDMQSHCIATLSRVGLAARSMSRHAFYCHSHIVENSSKARMLWFFFCWFVIVSRLVCRFCCCARDLGACFCAKLCSSIIPGARAARILHSYCLRVLYLIRCKWSADLYITQISEQVGRACHRAQIRYQGNEFLKFKAVIPWFLAGIEMWRTHLS